MVLSARALTKRTTQQWSALNNRGGRNVRGRRSSTSR